MPTYAQKQLQAYGNWPLKCINGLIAANASAIEKGQVMAFNTSTSKWVPYADGGANGVGTPLGIMSEKIEISAVDQYAPIVWKGPVIKSALVGYDANAISDFGAKVEENPQGTVVFLRNG